MTFPELFSDEWWDFMEGDFQYKAEEIRHPIFETYEDAVDRVQAPDGSGRHHETGDLLLGIPYLRGADRNFLQGLVSESQKLIPQLEDMFEARAVTADFFFGLNRFNFIYGYIAAIIMFSSDDLGPERSKVGSKRSAAAARILTQQRSKWVSHLLARQLGAGRKRKQAEHDVAKAINILIARDEFSSDFPKGWFEGILEDGKLRSSYLQKNLSQSKLNEVMVDTSIVVPSLDIEIPKT